MSKECRSSNGPMTVAPAPRRSGFRHSDLFRHSSLFRLALAQHHHADGCYQNDNADDLKRQSEVSEKQKSNSVDVVGCRSFDSAQDTPWQRRESLFGGVEPADNGENLDEESERNR